MAWASIEPGTDPPVLAIGCSPPEYGLCKQLAGCKHTPGDQIWRMPLTWPGYAMMRGVWAQQGIEIWPSLAEWAEAEWHKVQRQLDARIAPDATDGDLRGWLIDKDARMPAPPPGQPQYELTGWQRGGVQWLLDYRRAILGDERGNGKTPPLIRALQWLHEAEEGFPALVICPDAAPLAWQRKLKLWAPELRTQVIMHAAGARRKAIEQLRLGEADVGIIAWPNLRLHTRLAGYPGEAFVRCNDHGGSTGKSPAACEECAKEFNFPEEGRPRERESTWLRTVIADEVHRMSVPNTKLTRALWWLAHHSENLFAATGTLTVNSVADLWAVAHAISPRAWPVRSKYLDFYALQDFAYAGKGRVVLDLRPDTRSTFEVTMWPLFRRIPKEIARAGQPVLLEPEFRYPLLTPRQQRAYDSITKIGIAQLDDYGVDTLVPEAGIVAFTRQCQLAGSMLAVEDGEDPSGFTAEHVRRVLPSNKVDDLLEFLGDNPGQWIVAANSPPLIELAEGKLDAEKISHVKIVGGMPTTAKDASALAFQSGQARVIFISRAGGESIDLQAAEGIYWMEPDPIFVAREQMTGRADRFGQTHNVRQIHVISPGTVDVRLYQLGLTKEARHESVVKDAKLLRWCMSVQPGEIAGEGEGNVSIPA